MLNTLWLPERRYTSQYNLINDFIAQVGEAACRAGLAVNVEPAAEDAASSNGTEPMRPAALFFNHSPEFPSRARQAAEAFADRCETPVILHWLIDHPLTLRRDVWSSLETLPGYRLMTVSDDDTQLLALHYPKLRQARVWHGVPDNALCDAAGIAASHDAGGTRDIDVLVAGTVLSEPEIAQRRAGLPAPMQKVCEGIVDLRLAHPWMSFSQAWELTAPNGLHSATHWDLLHAVFVASTPAVNTRRRLALLKALDGLPVTVIGKGPWESLGLRNLTVVPEVAYADLPGWFSRARVTLAVNPTQFVHAFSERLLLGLAGGSACVSDDRLWVRREFATCCERFPAEQPQACRATVESLLADRSRAAQMGAAGRASVAAGHTWRHRLAALALLSSNAGREVGWDRSGLISTARG